jgi:hypothetical protein
MLDSQSASSGARGIKMQFMYVDESGDPGALRPGLPLHLQPSSHFILCGVIVPSAGWRQQLDAVVAARNAVLDPLGLPRRVELHARDILHPSIGSPFRSLHSKRLRIDMYRRLLSGVAHALPEMRLAAACLRKPAIAVPQGALGRSHFDMAWTRLLEEFDGHLAAGCTSDSGVILADDTDESRLRSLIRRMRRLGRTGGADPGDGKRGLRWIVEDAVLRQSQHSYFIQIADLAAYALYLREWPRGSLRRYGADRLFEDLEPKLTNAGVIGI